MSEYRIRETGEIITNLSTHFPNSSIPQSPTQEDYDALGIDPVFEGAQATPTTPYQYSQRGGVEEISGKWYTKYILGPVFEEYTDENEVLHTVEEQQAEYKTRIDEAQWNGIRQTRTRLLAESDWICAKSVDTGEPVPEEWKLYRQALRDITNQEDPFNIIWPTLPV